MRGEEQQEDLRLLKSSIEAKKINIKWINKKKKNQQNDAYMSGCFDRICLLVVDAPEARRVCSKRYPLRTGGKKREAFHFKVITFSRLMSQLKRSSASVNNLTYVAQILRFQEVIFDRTNPRSEPLGVTLQGYGWS